MKSKLLPAISFAVIFGCVAISTVALASAASAAEVLPAPKPVKVQPPLQIDPSTGLPAPTPIWIDPNWKDPDRVLQEVTYDGLPLGEVVRQLRHEFKGAFDVLLPNGWRDPNHPELSVDPQSTTITMQLKNVTASEVFNAMNMVFEAENTPYRWELKLNGNRPTAMLRVLPQLLRFPDPSPPPSPKVRMVYFVGDLLDDGKTGGMSMEKLVETVSQVFRMSFGDSKQVIQFHKDAQLLIVTGTSDQISFFQQTLAALRGKAPVDYRPPPPKPAEPKPKPPLPSPNPGPQ